MALSKNEVIEIVAQNLRNPLSMLHLFGGYYNGLDKTGRIIGPLVTYATEYEPGLRYVGWEYANWAKAEMHPYALKVIARRLLPEIPLGINCFCGVPEGGRSLATILSLEGNKRHIYLEKKTTKLATETEKAESELVFGRHEPEPGELIGLTEDVGNHFGSTAKSIDKVEAKGAKVGAIVCLHNRSQEIDNVFNYKGVNIPVVSYLRHPMKDYRQDDPAVAEEIARGNFVSDPKKQWEPLMAMMKMAA